MKKLKAFARRKGVECSFKRYGIDALGAMASGLFCTLLVGTILNTLAQQLGKLASKETRVDILVTPGVAILAGVALARVIAAPIGAAAQSVGLAIMWATELQPFLMGVFVAAIMGMALTLPISSAAICAAFGLAGLAGGAAVAGCCAGLILLCFVLPAVLSSVLCAAMKKWGWIADGDLKLNL